MADRTQRLLFLPLWTIFLLTAHCCYGDQKPHGMSTRSPPSVLSIPQRALQDGPLQDAQKEQGYYLQQLFLLYGENGTLSFQGLTDLLQSLGLGQVQVVEIQHEDLGHGHVSHLDILEVQEQRHAHSHSSLEHVSLPAGDPGANSTSSSIASERKQHVNVWTKRTTAEPTRPDVVSRTAEAPGKKAGARGASAARQGGPDTMQVSYVGGGREVIERLLLLDHESYNHLHEDCLNVTQLLLNYGLSGADELTPMQFSLICPALLYQIDSRVCIRHHDAVQLTPLEDTLKLAVLGFGFLAITLISVPSLLAVLLVPLLSHSLFRFLLVFLVALAVGTLCGDALLHLLPHAQRRHSEAAEPDQKGVPDDAILKGLSVLAGIYLLFLIENLLTLVKRRPRKKSKEEEYCGSQQETLEVLRGTASTQDESLKHAEAGTTGAAHHCSLLRYGEPGQEAARGSLCRAADDLQQHSGHSHGTRVTGATGIADIAWMVILGDGIHNFTDGLAIGAAFSRGIPSGLSTSVAVFCHELPHELGDFAVLLQAGMPVRRVMLFSLLSAFMGYLGMFVGATVSQSSSNVTPWIFAVTAGIFLYVALVDMLPDMLQRDPGRRGQMKAFILRNVGFLLGAALMLCIALFEDRIQFHLDL